MNTAENEPETADHPSLLDQLLERVRARYRRLDASVAAAAVAGGALLVDIRPEDQRARDGEVPGALVVERTMLEQRLAASGDDRVVIVLSADGSASSLAAASLQDLGLSQVTDVIGGFQAWRDSGSPVVQVSRKTVLRFAAV